MRGGGSNRAEEEWIGRGSEAIHVCTHNTVKLLEIGIPFECVVDIFTAIFHSDVKSLRVPCIGGTKNDRES